MSHTIQLPIRKPNQSEDEYIDACRKVMYDKLRSLNIDPMSVYPTSVGEMNLSGDTITWDMSMNCTRFEDDSN